MCDGDSCSTRSNPSRHPSEGIFGIQKRPKRPFLTLRFSFLAYVPFVDFDSKSYPCPYSAEGHPHLLPNDLVLGYIFDFFSRQAGLTTTSFAKKIVPGYNFGRVLAGWHIPGFDALHFLHFALHAPSVGIYVPPGSSGMFLDTIRSVLPVKIVP